MIRTFVGRKKELGFLEKEFAQNRKSFIVIYGRRRIGKTELIRKFLRHKQHIYFLVSQEPTNIQLERLIKKIAGFSGERVPKISDWEDAIDYIGEKLKEKKIILAIDEFTYLIDSNKSIPSYFQKLSEEYLNDSKSMLILSGSSVSMMESEVLGYKSPLYGRRTGQIDLAPFDFETIGMMITKNIKERIITNAVFGNIPMYLSFFDNNLSIEENILMNILDKNSFLYKEPEFILKQELREPSKYMAILFAIAHGNTKLTNISNKTGILSGTLSKYIEQLIKIRLVYKETPVTERNKKTKKSLYFISDGLFYFWFKFIEPNLSDVEDNPKHFLKKIIVPSLSSFVSRTFEKVCKEFVKENLDYGSVGRWWYKGEEIDIIGLNKQNNKILFAECKWQDDVDGIKLLRKLKEKARKIMWGPKNRKEEFIIFARSFSKKNNEARFYSLKEIGRFFKSHQSPCK